MSCFNTADVQRPSDYLLRQFRPNLVNDAFLYVQLYFTKHVVARDAIQARPMPSCGVCPSVRPSVCHIRVFLSKRINTHTHTTLFTKTWQIQSIDISVRKENKYIYIYIYTNKKINRCKVILTTIN